LKIAVCIKQVIDTSLPVELSPSGAKLVEEDLCYMVNPADECAVEEALRIKESRPGAEVMLLSLGPPRVEQALRRCMAMGADRALHLWDNAFTDSDVMVRARILAEAISGIEADLVLCGSRSQDIDDGQVPGIIADILNLPLLPSITSLELKDDGSTIKVERKLDRGDREIVECPLPALLSVETGINQPRYAGLPELMEALLNPPEKMGMTDIGLSYGTVGSSASPTKLVGLTPPKPRTKKSISMDSSMSPEDRLKMLSTGGMTEKKGDLWQGTPEELARKLVELLKKEGFLLP